eukprot:TRINITY_DN50406_c0_g1_i1.p1 TRINITY_DN50406_c0_g1~~TRINITY_DN50406_c0_g1_i1.p1  ORF type:complete len:400 (+),score=55.47 TRINITY_DN50406_c0_g1_i1:116-1315(+)
MANRSARAIVGDDASEPPEKFAAISPPSNVLPVDISWEKLVAGEDVNDEISEAFGPGGLGILTLSGLPPRVGELRRLVLSMGRKLACLPSETLKKYELPETGYMVGWSKGREQFKGKPDVSKGSFYANPIFDEPADGDAELIEKHPFLSPNVWPTEAGDNFELVYKELGRKMFDIARPLVAACDRFVGEHLGADEFTTLTDACYSGSRLHLGRLLHYFAGGNQGATSDDTWCGWHNDNSVMTVLVPGLWLFEDTGDEVPGEMLTGSSAGLIAKRTDGSSVRVQIRRDRLGLQLGEASQILSGGVLRATPHAVRGLSGVPAESPLARVSRESMALFIEPGVGYSLVPPLGRTREDICRDEHLFPDIPPLSSRLPRLPVQFTDYLSTSFQAYLKMADPSAE